MVNYSEDGAEAPTREGVLLAWLSDNLDYIHAMRAVIAEAGEGERRKKKKNDIPGYIPNPRRDDGHEAFWNASYEAYSTLTTLVQLLEEDRITCTEYLVYYHDNVLSELTEAEKEFSRIYPSLGAALGRDTATLVRLLNPFHAGVDDSFMGSLILTAKQGAWLTVAAHALVGAPLIEAGINYDGWTFEAILKLLLHGQVLLIEAACAGMGVGGLHLSGHLLSKLATLRLLGEAAGDVAKAVGEALRQRVEAVMERLHPEQDPLLARLDAAGLLETPKRSFLRLVEGEAQDNGSDATPEQRHFRSRGR